MQTVARSKTIYVNLERAGKTVSFPIEASRVSKTWAIHRTVVWRPPEAPYQSDRWTVSHIPTGRSLASYLKYKSVARRIAELAAEVAPWQIDDPSVAEAFSGIDLRSFLAHLQQMRHMGSADMVKAIDAFAEKIRNRAKNPRRKKDEHVDPEPDRVKGPWVTGYLVPKERRNGYTHLIRAASDPEMTTHRGKAAGYDPVGWKKYRQLPAAVQEKKILHHLDDGEPRTFNRIAVELYDRTADIVSEGGIDDALWNLVEQGKVEHDMVAPILFRATKPKRGRKKPASAALLEDKRDILARAKMSARERMCRSARGRKKLAKKHKEKETRAAKKKTRELDLIALARKARAKNPTWRIGSHQVEVQYDHDMHGWAYQFDGAGQWWGPFGDESEALKDAIREIDDMTKPVGIIGDVDPIRNDGGIVYKRGDHYFMRYFQTYGDKEEKVSIYSIDLAEPWKDLTWVKWDRLADNIDADLGELEEAAKSDDPFTRARVYEDVGSYYGYGELDSDADDMTVEEAEKQYGNDVRVVHEMERQAMYRNPVEAIKERMLAW